MISQTKKELCWRNRCKIMHLKKAPKNFFVKMFDCFLSQIDGSVLNDKQVFRKRSLQ